MLPRTDPIIIGQPNQFYQEMSMTRQPTPAAFNDLSRFHTIGYDDNVVQDAGTFSWSQRLRGQKRT